MKKSLALAELLLATAIAAVVLSILLFLFVSCINLNGSNRNLTIALTHAQYVMEEIKNTNFSNITSASWANTEVASRGLTPLDNEAIIITVSGTNTLDTEVRVNWNDKTGRVRNVALRTLIVEP